MVARHCASTVACHTLLAVERVTWPLHTAPDAQALELYAKAESLELTDEQRQMVEEKAAAAEAGVAELKLREDMVQVAAGPSSPLAPQRWLTASDRLPWTGNQ